MKVRHKFRVMPSRFPFDPRLTLFEEGRILLADGRVIVARLVSKPMNDELRWTVEDFSSALDDLRAAIDQNQIYWVHDALAEVRDLAKDIQSFFDGGDLWNDE